VSPTAVIATVTEPVPRRWTRDEYAAMGEAGLFDGQRVELIAGEVVVTVSPQNWPHASTLDRVARVIGRAFGPGYWVRTQLPLALLPDSEPEPDVSVVPGGVDDYDAHPSRALLVVEVSVTTLAYDRREKAGLYARAGVPEYWVVNLIDGQVEVYRGPSATGFQTAEVVRPGESIRLHANGTPVAVRDFLA